MSEGGDKPQAQKRQGANESEVSSAEIKRPAIDLTPDEDVITEIHISTPEYSELLNDSDEV